MFGQGNKGSSDDQIPDHSIDGAMGEHHPMGPPHAQITPVDPTGGSGQPWQHPGVSVDPAATPTPDPSPAVDPLADPAPIVDDKPIADIIGTGGHPGTPLPSITTNHPAPQDHSASQDLMDIKQQALGQLSPLVGHLDQSPEEQFRTTMMMIQASDNQDLIPKAYEAANQIPDEKAKAQALLDIVNEINYFTSHHKAPAPEDHPES